MFDLRNVKIISLIVSMLALASGFALWEVRDRAHRIDIRAHEIALSFLQLERAIGYSGMIHNFKNAVLRPGEPDYLDRAEADYRNALMTLQTVQSLLDKAEIDVDVTGFRTTLAQYGQAIGKIRTAREAGLDAPAVDALVRIDDSAAHDDLVFLQRKVATFLADRDRAIAQISLVSTAAFLVCFGLLMGVIVLAARADQRSRLEAARHQHDLDQQRAHARALSGLVAQLENANREQAEFTYAISHDLKSPANTIAMLIDELGRSESLDADAREMLVDMSTTNAHMRQLVDDVLEYAQVLGEEMVTEPVDLNDLLDRICRDLAGDIDRAGAQITYDALPTMCGNTMQLRMLFQNLVSNAVKFRAPGRPARVDISAQQGPEGLTITVADNGIGIPEEYRARIFGLFQRLNKRSDFQGTGIGLAICQRVMMNHDGLIRVETGPDGGTAMVLVFPGWQTRTTDAPEAPEDMAA